jgi:hypothetical protein
VRVRACVDVIGSGLRAGNDVGKADVVRPEYDAAFGDVGAGGFESTRIAATSSTDIATALSARSDLPTRPVICSRRGMTRN